VTRTNVFLSAALFGTEANSQQSEESSMGIVAIIGIGVGAALGLALILLAGIVRARRSKAVSESGPREMDMGTTAFSLAEAGLATPITCVSPFLTELWNEDWGVDALETFPDAYGRE
jgi:NhaP-type Na+/H+ or K+/H+ antiporter